MKISESLVMVFLLSCRVAGAHDATVLPGTWKGISICQIKSSPCHDENAVYISQVEGANSF